MEKQSVSNGAIVNGGKVEGGINITINISTSGDNSGVTIEGVRTLAESVSTLAACAEFLVNEIKQLKNGLHQVNNG